MNESETQTESPKKITRYQAFKLKVRHQIMRVLPISLILGTMAVGNAAAFNNTSFQGIIDVIDAVIPLFSSIIDLVIAIVPLTITMAIVGGLVILINKALSKAFK